MYRSKEHPEDVASYYNNVTLTTTFSTTQYAPVRFAAEGTLGAERAVEALRADVSSVTVRVALAGSPTAVVTSTTLVGRIVCLLMGDVISQTGHIVT